VERISSYLRDKNGSARHGSLCFTGLSVLPWFLTWKGNAGEVVEESKIPRTLTEAKFEVQLDKAAVREDKLDRGEQFWPRHTSCAVYAPVAVGIFEFDDFKLDRAALNCRAPDEA
jgi:hypothetical protein